VHTDEVVILIGKQELPTVTVIEFNKTAKTGNP